MPLSVTAAVGVVPTRSPSAAAGPVVSAAPLRLGFLIGLARTDPLFFHDLRLFPPLHDLGLNFGFVALALADQRFEVAQFVGGTRLSELVMMMHDDDWMDEHINIINNHNAHLQIIDTTFTANCHHIPTNQRPHP